MKLVNSLLIVFVFTAAEAAAQTAEASRGPNIAIQIPSNSFADAANALQTRETFRQILRGYSPSLGEVFRLDPALLTNKAFLAPYPRLAAFLDQHPEVAHNPSFYVGDTFNRINNLDTAEGRSYEMFENIMGGIAMFAGALILVSVFGWMIRTVIDHRRWLRVAKVQSDVHSKLLDRFASNQDLLAYIQTPAGRHFLESSPINIEPSSRGMSAPAGRILFSVQAGIVLTLAGLGMHLVSRTVDLAEVSQALLVIGTLSTAVGIGFVLSAGAAYVLSRRLGLLNQTPLPSTSDNAGVSPPNA